MIVSSAFPDLGHGRTAPDFSPYMTTGKTIALTRRTFIGKIMSLLFNMLSRLVEVVEFQLSYFKS